ncbi:hypothetical protein [Bradyrhizobium elkanii]|uniref:hypothetical protein n=1 Tax=Bradyrhizobium elkanii TaxID=29448 RepID=UPI002729558B|nr:hypothetical protein [Bradyrhizobium elkanii]WLA80302.1 hypothetical protein QNJ99_33695 [Bradyrhizobium elkanii]
MRKDEISVNFVTTDLAQPTITLEYFISRERFRRRRIICRSTTVVVNPIGISPGRIFSHRNVAIDTLNAALDLPEFEALLTAARGSVQRGSKTTPALNACMLEP